MDINHLEDEELIFELSLRGVKQSPTMDRKLKLKTLKELLDKEAKDKNIPSNSTNVASDVDNIYQCQARISPIIHLVEAAIRQNSVPVLKRYQSRLLHYRFRLSLIQDPLITSNANKTISKLEAALSKIEDIKEVLQQHVLIGQQHNDEREQQQRQEQQQLQQQREQLKWEQQQFEQQKQEQQRNFESQPQQQRTSPYSLGHLAPPDQTRQVQYQDIIRQQQIQVQQFAQIQE
ncbi:putative uncharacterized protein DDB_G0274435 [Uranotaenia lowii]|uniref:putative uncharacterized protein DDB_G0274435 n=1 Tax=Uranotaenia lowii TaxID=190385 RepID=UPI00247A44C3|nr:putative uncharacterized protein DDB_G0274435 [Uranotaenia lowii]